MRRLDEMTSGSEGNSWRIDSTDMVMLQATLVFLAKFRTGTSHHRRTLSEIRITRHMPYISSLITGLQQSVTMREIGWFVFISFLSLPSFEEVSLLRVTNGSDGSVVRITLPVGPPASLLNLRLYQHVSTPSQKFTGTTDSLLYSLTTSHTRVTGSLPMFIVQGCLDECEVDCVRYVNAVQHRWIARP